MARVAQPTAGKAPASCCIAGRFKVAAAGGPTPCWARPLTPPCLAGGSPVRPPIALPPCSALPAAVGTSTLQGG